MFSNIGRKLQTFGKVFAILGIVGAVLTGILLIVAGIKGGLSLNGITVSGTGGTVLGIILGLIVIIFGSLNSLLVNYLLIGFGIIVDAAED
jgi:hypothetical protein